MNKIIAYVLAIVGIIIVIISFNLSLLKINLPTAIKPAYIMILGLGLVIFGIIMILSGNSSGSGKQIENEVPIYHKDKIVGYRKAYHK